MRKFESLNPKEHPEHFNVEEHGEQPFIILNEDEGRIDVSYIFPGFYISDHVRNIRDQEITFKQINIGGTGWISESGRPLLPSFGRYVQIPPGCAFSITWTTNGEPVVFDDVLLYPSQSMLKDGVNEKVEFEYDKKFYEKTAVYPKKIVGTRGPLEVDGYSSFLLNVCPLQYFPSKKRLEGYGNITVNIALKAKKEAVTISPYDPATNTMGYGNLFVNPEPGVEERVFPGVKYCLPPVISKGPEFIIIYHNLFNDAAENLAEWKNMRGLRTETVSIDDIGNTEPDIKNYIRFRRKHFRSRLRYVLLFGDVDHIKSEIIHKNLTDHYYSTQNNPSVDKYELPWLAIGRIPVQTKDEAKQVVDQIIRYEETPPMEQDYYDRMVFVAYFQDNYPKDGDGIDECAFIQTMEKIRQQMLQFDFNIDRIYVKKTNSPQPQKYVDSGKIDQDVIDEIKEAGQKNPIGKTPTDELVDATIKGQLIIAQRGHGTSDGWETPSFTTVDLEKVVNSVVSSKEVPVPTIFYSLSCLTGMFNRDEAKWGKCFAEKMLSIDAGAPSLIACTSLANTWLNNYLMKAFFHAMWGNILDAEDSANVSYPVRKNRLGDILNYGKHYLPLKVGDFPVESTTTATEVVQDSLEIVCVIGDPTLEIWKEKPKRIRISAILWKSQIYIRLSLCPADAVITIWSGDKLIKRIEPLSTTLTISLRGISADPLLPVTKMFKYKYKVCFWAPGYRFVQVVPKFKA